LGGFCKKKARVGEIRDKQGKKKYIAVEKRKKGGYTNTLGAREGGKKTKTDQAKKRPGRRRKKGAFPKPKYKLKRDQQQKGGGGGESDPER